MPSVPGSTTHKSLMALVIDHQQHLGFKPLARTHHICKLRSFSHVPDLCPVELERTIRSVAAAATRVTFQRSYSTPCLSASSDKVDEEPNIDQACVEILAGRGKHAIRALVVEATIALWSGVDLVSAPGGLTCAYYLCSRGGNKVAVVKPIDEDLSASTTSTLTSLVLGHPNRSVQVGETGIREVAAYLLDHGGFAGVPPTTLVNISQPPFLRGHSKIASIQRFVAHDYDAGDLGPSSFSVSSIHRIGILDVRILNIDRHTGNILVKKQGHEGGYGSYLNDGCTVGGPAELVPIDHGLCLPESLDDPYFEWLHWPQASVPFSELEFDYINKLDPTSDANLLRSELPSLRESSIRILVLCTIFLKRAAKAGLCLADIGDLMTREFRGTEEEPSMLETLCTRAKAYMITEVDDGEGGGDSDSFQFDIEFEDTTVDQEVNILELPPLLRRRPLAGRPPRVPPKFSSSKSIMGRRVKEVLSPLKEEDKDGDEAVEDGDKKEGSSTDGNMSCESGDDEQKPTGGLIKSLSISVIKHNPESGDISFKGMSEEEWELFLERFEELLPQAFESRKSMELKPRLGTSCKF